MMKNGFKRYAAAWLVILVVFNVLCFATPNHLAGYTKLDATFWTAYVFMTLAFVGQLVCAWFALKAENAKKLFYNLPLVTISYTGLVLMLVFGGLTIAVPNLPAWVGVILCVIILGFTAVAVIKAGAAAEIAEKVDEKVKTQTSFIRKTTAEAEGLIARANTPEAKEVCKKIVEALRYSDPMSNDELNVIEAKITVKLSELSDALAAADDGKIASVGKKLEALIGDRARKCKVLK